MAVLESEVVVRCQPHDLFDFINTPANRPHVTPPHVQLDLTNVPDLFAEGARFAFEVRAFGQKQRFEHEIVSWSRPLGFTERQVEGPFGAMVHDRRIAETDGGALLVERVEFEPPGGLLGFLLTESRIRSMLTEGFAHQSQALKRLLEVTG